MKKIIPCVLSMLMAVLLTACAAGGSHTSGNVRDTGDSEKTQIGVTFDCFIIERWERDRDIFVSTAKDLGADVNVQNANGDVEEQKKQIEYFIKKKMDVIVIIAVDSTSLSDEVKKARDDGIKVIAYERPIKNSDVDL